MKFVFLMDPIEDILPDKDSTFLMMLESERRGHQVLYGQIGDLLMDGSRLKGRLFPASVCHSTPHFELGDGMDVYLDEADAVFMRKDPPIDMAYTFTMYMLDRLAESTLVINDPIGVLRANEKLYALHFPSVIPLTRVTRDIARLKGFLTELGGQMIIKPWDAAGGHGVLRVQKGDPNLNSLLELSTDHGQTYVIAQQYVPEAALGDKRIIVINGEPLGGILRVPSSEDPRGNIHVGATVHRTTLTAREQAICHTIGPLLKRDGLLFVGIDILGDYLIEVNVTSPTGIQELNALDGIHAENTLLDHVEDFVRRGITRMAMS